MRHTIRRFQRRPVPAIGVMLFAAVLAVVLCGLQKSNEAELEKYNGTYHTIPVQFSVTNLSATKATDLNIPNFFADVFIQEDGLGRFVSDLQRVCTHSITGQNSRYMLVGITSTALSIELWAENGTYIHWDEGYGEGTFAGNEPVCLVPDTMIVSNEEETGTSYVELDFAFWGIDPTTEYSCKLRVIGTYKGGDGNAIYCPFAICEKVYTELKEPLSIQAIRATLRSNDDLGELRDVSKQWFAEPNPLGEQTPWGDYGYTYYPYALDIDDELLQQAVATLQTRIAINRICTVLVLCLSAVAGLLIGFLMVRSRRREIALMRTMGTPTPAIFAGFLIEQMLCFGLGTALGGAYNRWDSADSLGILAAAFLAGLVAALFLFLRKNLLVTLKEDE
ncbi:MAG: ABC transporter permease [Firmicutes bacterium]|nr:ABC transporter permease [Bacillota bacterium]